jgi:hypothetical protein
METEKIVSMGVGIFSPLSMCLDGKIYY